MSTAQDMAQFIPDKYRKILYTVLYVVGAVLIATSAGYAAVAVALPKWLIFAWAAYGTVSAPAQFVAKSNVAPQTPSAPR